jgi:HD domain-containing protein/MASE9 protein
MRSPEGRLSLFNRYVGAVFIGALGALVLAAWGQTWQASPAFFNAVISLLALAFLAELTAVQVQPAGASQSMAFIPLLAAAFLFDPLWAMLIGGITQYAGTKLVRKKPWIRVVFNASKEVLAVGLASAMYRLLNGVPSVTDYHFAPIAVLGAGVAYTIVDSVAVGYGLSLLEGEAFSETWLRTYGGTVVYDVLSWSIPALLAFLYVKFQLVGVVVLTVPLFVVRHVYLQNLRLEQSTRELLELMVKQIEAMEPYTSGHSRRVQQYARIIAREAGIHARQIEQIATAALLHDVGKYHEKYWPLLRKEGKLTAEEKELLQSHPVRSAELIATISSFRGFVENSVRHHHENYDGSGYPDGLAGDGIPIGARIIMIADTLDAMTTDRPYRKALPFDRVVEELLKYAGKQFDPRLARVLIESSVIRRSIVWESEVTAPIAQPVLEHGGQARPQPVGV